MSNPTKIILLVLGLMVVHPVLFAQAPLATKNETSYTRLFKGKTVKTKRGLITLHKAEGKVYFEFPVKLLNRNMLLGSVAESVSHSDDVVAGEQAHDPLCIYFTLMDSTIQIKSRQFGITAAAADNNVRNALGKNNIDPILASFRIQATAPDSQAVVFEPTSFFVSGNAAMDPFQEVGGLSSRRTSFKAETSLLDDIMAFEDNVTISSYLSFGVTTTFWGFMTAEDRPSTILMKRSLVLLPDATMRPRFNDPRIGIFYTDHMQYSGAGDGAKSIYYANRWRLEPRNEAAWKKGELTEPLKPIVYYIDDKFPAQWVDYIRQGVEDWNKAFEKIGFKQAIITRPYPKNDSTFDPNNIRYNCIKYAPTRTQNAMGPSWVDPRTGEILYASVYIYHGIVDILNDWMFVQMAAADKRVRTTNMPPDLMGRAIRYMTAHEVGHTLGLMHNMGASSAFPVDSLRSPTFTQQYGTTPSIMDYARFNFVAQPGDVERGVAMTPPNLGVYDYYAIKWLYSPIPQATTPEQEVPVLNKWISEKITDPMYRYGKQQFYGNLDPSSLTEDLGNDQVKATRYMMQNLQYIMKNYNQWVQGEDENYSFRQTMNFAIINIHFYWYWTHVLHNIGGIYQYEKYEGDPFPAYKVVPKAKQRESVQFLLETLENLSWMNNPELEQQKNAMNGDASEFMRTILFPYMMRWVANIGLSEAKAADDPYTQAECIADVFNYVWGSTKAGKKPTQEKLGMQTTLVKLLIQQSRVGERSGAGAAGFADLSEEEIALAKMEELAIRYSPQHGPLVPKTDKLHGIKDRSGPISGFGYLPGIRFQSADISHLYYQWLLQCKEVLQQVIPKHTGDTQLQYRYLLLLINKSLKIQ